MQALYADDLLTLAKREPVPFNHEAFAKAAKRLYDEGKFTTDLLDTDEGRGLTEETYNALNGAISYSIQEETPSELTAALRNNAFIFSGFKTYHQMREAGTLFTREDGSVRSYGEFESEVKRIDEKYNTQYLYAEYNHAVHTSQMAAKWHEWEKDGDEYNLQYRTAGDERVREAHAALDGVTLPPSDKFWNNYLPPNGWNCRCQVVQVLRDDYKQSNSDQATEWGDACTSDPKAKMFRYNAGKEMKLFPPKHPYMPKGCGKCDYKLGYDINSEKCQACLIFQKCWKEKVRTENNRERLHYLQEMAHLLGKKVVVNGNGHPMNVGFEIERNKHLYSDTFFRSKVLQKEDLKDLDKLLEQATFVTKAALSKPRTDEIKRFYYYAVQLHGQTVYLNVAEYEHVRDDGKIDRKRVLYSVTDHLKEKKT